MHGFKDVTLSWGGESYTVPADRQLMLIAELEDSLRGQSGLPAVSVLLQRGGPSFARLSAAFGTALRYAGAQVTDDEIYLSMQEDFAQESAEVADKVQTAVIGLLSIISPPMARQFSGPTEKKPEGAD